MTKAALSEVSGQPLVVRNITPAEPGPGQVRVRVAACGINFPDTLLLDDRYQFKPSRPFAPGGEVAGHVDAIGPGVQGFKLDDAVLGRALFGGLSQSLVLNVNQCVHMPAGMPMDEGAALLLTYGTAYYALRHRGHLSAGDTLLVTGAAGGVGLAAIQLGKAWGARVVVAVSSSDKLDFALRHGADAGWVYPVGELSRDASRALAASIKDVVGPNGANVVLDVVGGDIAEPCLRATAWEGRFLVVGFPAGIPRLPLNLVLLKGCQVVGVSLGEWIGREPQLFAESAQDLFKLYAAGHIRPFISQRFPLEQANEALAQLSGRRALGKVVVTMNSNRIKT